MCGLFKLKDEEEKLVFLYFFFPSLQATPATLFPISSSLFYVIIKKRRAGN